MLLKKYLPLFVIPLIIFCGPGLDPAQLHENIPLPSGEVVETFPAAPLFEAGEIGPLATAGKLEALLHLEEAVVLETLDSSIVGEVTDLILHRDQWWVADRLGETVFRFQRDGRFVDMVGGFGQGPGEYQMPQRVLSIYGGLVGVCDPLSRKILAFDGEGRFVRETPLHYDGRVIAANFSFLWPQPDRLYISAFQSLTIDAPNHVAVDPDKAKILFGFDERIETVARAGAERSVNVAHTAFAMVDGRIWSGSPFKTSIDVFDRNGNRLAELGGRVPRDEERFIMPKDYENLHHKPKLQQYMMRRIMPKWSNQKILPMGDLVLVQLKKAIDVYDRHGNLLRANLLTDHVYSFWFSDGEHLIKVYTEGMEQSALEPEVRARLAELDLPTSHNPVLLLFKLWRRSSQI